MTWSSTTSVLHYDDVIMGAMASQITILTIVYSTVYSNADQRKHQSSASLAFVRGIHRGPVNSPHKWSVTRKIFPFDDVIMDQGEIWTRHLPMMFVVTGQQCTCHHFTLKRNHYLAKDSSLIAPKAVFFQLFTEISSTWWCFHLSVYEVRPKDYTHESHFILCCCVKQHENPYCYRNKA